MKIIWHIVFLLMTAIISVSCSIFDSTNTMVIVKNQSNYFIDSTIFNINGFKLKVIEIEINTEKKVEILQSLIPSNNHDVSVFATTYLKNGKKINAQFYNDLSGSPGKSITAIIDSNLNLILKPEW